MPPLNPGPSLPQPYLEMSKRHVNKPTQLKDPEVERIQDLATTASIASTLPPPPELSKKTGQPLTKAEKKAVGHRSPRCQFLRSRSCLGIS